ncbi:hypothetical protein B0T10DRAFT_418720 [Thelonectria olida]|uniref:BZIP domain-containing protein n=1 Tax=Thelonectria olida TaxID=1576542 RepID=A0A9P8VR49_9HYPO|nr:hypothetical protein B0T10DRAFT_418720 [Thelonectria olida]
MTTFVQSHPPPISEFPFSTAGFDATTSTLLSEQPPPPPYRISIDFPVPQTNMTFQPEMNQMPYSPFFNEAISNPPIPTQMEDPFSQCPPRLSLPQSFPKFSNLQNRELRPLPALSCPPNVPIELDDNVLEPGKDALNARNRGRKRKGDQKVSDTVVKSTNFNGQAYSRNSRRRNTLERNRVAAIRCRMRKRDEESALSARTKEMEEHNRQLSKTFNELQAECHHLKTQLLRHTDCNCALIHKYIAHEARKCVPGVQADPSTLQLDIMPLVSYQSGPNGSRASDSVASITDSYGNRTPELEDDPPTWLDISSSAKAMCNMTKEAMQNTIMPVPSQLMSSIPWMHGPDSLCSWVDTGPFFLTMGGNEFWGENMGF